MKEALKKLSLLVTFITVFAVSAMAQRTQEVEMADVLRRDGKIYTVVIGLLIVVTGFILFLLRIEKRVNRLGKK